MTPPAGSRADMTDIKNKQKETRYSRLLLCFVTSEGERGSEMRGRIVNCYKYALISVANCASRLMRRLVISFENSSAALY